MAPQHIEQGYKNFKSRRYVMVVVGGTIVLATLLLLPLFLPESYLVHIGTLVLLNSIGAMSLNLIFRMGQVSLGHAAFMGVGGYTSALLTTLVGVPWPFAFLAAGAAGAALALLVGPIILRLTGVYFVLITFTLGEIVQLVFVEWVSLTGGSDGVYQIPPPAPFLRDPTASYYLAFTAALLCWVFCFRLLRSDIGRAVNALRESESLAETNGVPVFRVKLIIFVISSVLVALQGSLEAHFIHYISPLTYSFGESLRFAVMNVIGGLTSLVGAIIGALFMIALPELLRGWVEYQWLMFGIALVAVMRFFPGGLYELIDRALAVIGETRIGGSHQ